MAVTSSTGSTSRDPKAIIFTNKASQSADIAALKVSIQAGKKIFRSDINSIITLINNMLGHYHTYDDYIQNPSYGTAYGDNPSAGDRTLYATTKDTSRPTNFPSTFAAIAAGSVISAGSINVGLSAIRAMGSHKHAIQDQTTR